MTSVALKRSPSRMTIRKIHVYRVFSRSPQRLVEVTFWYFFFFSFYRNNQPSASLSDLYIDANVKLQTSTSKSLPNTPKNEQLQIQPGRTRASSAVVNAEHRTDNDFHELDAYLERKRMERHGAFRESAGSEDYDDDRTRDGMESFFEYRMPSVPSYADARLCLSDDNSPSSSAFGARNEGKLSGRYQETFFPHSIFFQNYLSNQPARRFVYFEMYIYIYMLYLRTCYIY